MDTTDNTKNNQNNPLNILYYENRELELLKNAINIEAKKRGERIAKNPVMKDIISVLEKFISDKHLVCYGGTAINNILPPVDQFYNRDLEIPDYDFFSPNAMNDAKALADIYYKQGFSDVEAKAGVHYGTYKVFVNFFQIADVTQLDSRLFSSLKKNAVIKDGIHYSPPNFLRMAMYLELSRPGGDITRWEKVLKRLNLLNKNYPLKAEKCDPETFRHSLSARSTAKQYYYQKEIIQNVIKDIVSSDSLVYIGGYANALYSRYLKNREKMFLNEIPEFDILSNTPDKTAKKIKEEFVFLKPKKFFNNSSNIALMYTGTTLIDKNKFNVPHYEIYLGMDFFEGEINESNLESVECKYRGLYLGQETELFFSKYNPYDFSTHRVFVPEKTDELQKQDTKVPDLKEDTNKAPASKGGQYTRKNRRGNLRKTKKHI